jgi:hypothetical protein
MNPDVWASQVTYLLSSFLQCLFSRLARGTDSKVQGASLAAPWILTFNYLLIQTVKGLQKQN